MAHTQYYRKNLISTSFSSPICGFEPTRITIASNSHLQNYHPVKICCSYSNSKSNTNSNSNSNSNSSTNLKKKLCLRCNTLYDPLLNSPTACSFHGHITGEKGLFSLAPPHQGIDGEWTDGSGVIVYKWNEVNNRPNTGSANWKKRWSCCSEYDENAPPCQHGYHVSYDDGFTMY